MTRKFKIDIRYGELMTRKFKIDEEVDTVDLYTIMYYTEHDYTKWEISKPPIS